MSLTSIVTVWCFPDSAIGRRYILAKTANGAYSLVPDNSHVPGITVSAKDIHHISGAQLVVSCSYIGVSSTKIMKIDRDHFHDV